MVRQVRWEYVCGASEGGQGHGDMCGFVACIHVGVDCYVQPSMHGTIIAMVIHVWGSKGCAQNG